MENIKQAITDGDFDEVKNLIKGVDVNGEEGHTLLIEAVHRNKTEIVDLLIATGADVHAKEKDNRGRTALICAAWSGSTEIIKLLLAAGAEINTKDNEGHSALDIAADLAQVDSLKFLISEGADLSNVTKYVNINDYKKARNQNYRNVAELLIKAGAEKLGNEANKKANTNKKIYIEYLKKQKWEMDPKEVISLLTHTIGADREEKGKIAIGSSKFGGTPDLPKSEEWPVYGPPQAFDRMELAERKENKEHIPFMAQINTREFDHKNQLPDGIYYYFISFDEGVCDAKVVFYDGDIKNLRKHKKPNNVEIHEESKLVFKKYYTLPLDTEVEPLNFKGDDSDTYDFLDHKKIYSPFIQILGHLYFEPDDSITAKEKLLIFFEDYSIFAIESEDGEERVNMED